MPEFDFFGRPIHHGKKSGAKAKAGAANVSRGHKASRPSKSKGPLKGRGSMGKANPPKR